MARIHARVHARALWACTVGVCLLACEQKKRSAPLLDQTVEITLVSAGDGGAATNAVMIGETAAFPLPAGDTPAPDRKPEMRAPGVYVVTLHDGLVRPVYLGLGSLFFGPRLPAAEAAGDAITFVGGATTAWTDPALRTTVVQVAQERELGELPAVLASVADRIEGPVWIEAVRSLSTDERSTLARALAPALLAAEGERPRFLAAALVVELDANPEAVAARLMPLRSGTEVPEGPERLATALLLRSLQRTRPGEAAAIACRVLATPPEAGDPLLGAALLASISSAAEASCLGAVRTILDKNACTSDARCAAGAPVLGADSAEDEPVCTREEAHRVAEAEAKRTPWSLAESPHSPTTLLALHAAYEARSVPVGFVTAHARRRFSIDARGPACAEVATESAPCTPPEAELRHAACLATMPKARSESATFLIDARAKKLRETRRTLKAR